MHIMLCLFAASCVHKWRWDPTNRLESATKEGEFASSPTPSSSCTLIVNYILCTRYTERRLCQRINNKRGLLTFIIHLDFVWVFCSFIQYFKEIQDFLMADRLKSNKNDTAREQEISKRFSELLKLITFWISTNTFLYFVFFRIFSCFFVIFRNFP